MKREYDLAIKTSGETDMQLILKLLHRASQSAEDLLSTRLNDSILTPRQLTVLQAAASDPEASQTALVSQTGIDRSTLADIVRRLVQAGLLERERMSTDARMYAVRVTERGHQTLAAVDPVADEVANAVLAAVSDEDAVVLKRALEAIADKLGPVASARVSERAKSLQLRNIRPVQATI